jgi:hypothetical protein
LRATIRDTGSRYSTRYVVHMVYAMSGVSARKNVCTSRPWKIWSLKIVTTQYGPGGNRVKRVLLVLLLSPSPTPFIIYIGNIIKPITRSLLLNLLYAAAKLLSSDHVSTNIIIRVHLECRCALCSLGLIRLFVYLYRYSIYVTYCAIELFHKLDG